MNAGYPPKSWEELAAYDSAECIEGSRDFTEGAPEPGDNRSPSYRWGYATAKADRDGTMDQYYVMRRRFIREIVLA